MNKKILIEKNYDHIKKLVVLETLSFYLSLSFHINRAEFTNTL